MRKHGIALVSAAAAMAAGFALPATAVAAPETAGTNNTAKTSNNSGSVKFHHQGDKLVAYDNASDGKGIYVKYYRYDTDSSGEFTNRKGYDKTATHDMNMREGSSIKFEVCTIDADGDKGNCSEEKYGKA